MTILRLNIPNKHIAAVCIVAAVVIAVAAGYERTTVKLESFDAVRGTFIVDVVASGEVKSGESRTVKGPGGVGELKIVELAPEGSIVKEGDFLIRFDDTWVRQKLAEYEQDLQIKLNEYHVLLSSCRADSIRGFHRLEKEHLQAELRKIGLGSPYKAGIEQASDKMTVETLRLSLLDVKDTIEIDKLTKKEEISKKLDEIKTVRERVENYRKRVADCVVYAPVSGMALYLEVYSGHDLTKEKIRIGTISMFYGDPLIELSGDTGLIVKTGVNEKEVGRIRKGQKAVITFDSNDAVYYGTVSQVGIIAYKEYSDPADREKFEMLYNVEVSIEECGDAGTGGSNPIPGMQANCRIVTDRLEDVVYVPVQAVFGDEDGACVFVRHGGSFRKTPVKTGITTADFVVIEEGLAAGQTVSLWNPGEEFHDVGMPAEQARGRTLFGR